MKSRAFTLIELLVVVLIIGILAAIALPQYQKAVKKTHLVKALPTLTAISRAKKIYYLANGNYTNDLDALDINISYTSSSGSATTSKVYEGVEMGGTLQLSSTGEAAKWNSPYGFTLEVYEHNAYCYGDDDLCKSLGKFYFTTESGTNVYELKF